MMTLLYYIPVLATAMGVIRHIRLRMAVGPFVNIISNKIAARKQLVSRTRTLTVKNSYGYLYCNKDIMTFII